MTKFIDGPAAGKTLMLRRAPMVLRVVQDWEGFDALDQLSDEPKVNEKIHLYEIVGKPGWIHINSQDKKGRHNGGTYTIAEYKLFQPQPKDQCMREDWPVWCGVHKAEIMERHRVVDDARAT